MTNDSIRLHWEEPNACRRFRAAVSLHSHTLHSRESLTFIPAVAAQVPVLRDFYSRLVERHELQSGEPLDLSRAWWTPPLTPREAMRIEREQIHRVLSLDAMVSLSDHDDIEGPMALRVLDDCRNTPVSVEWTVPFGPTFFHIGVHNLPVSRATAMFAEMRAYTANPDPASLICIFEWLNQERDTLLIFNHPCWDEKRIGAARHRAVLEDFLNRHHQYLHAMEWNGFRPWAENSDSVAWAARYELPVISGGDRHGREANVLCNLTNAANFAEFAEEVRAGQSHVLILPAYREGLRMRIVHCLCDILGDSGDHGLGWTTWRDRIFYRCNDGAVRSVKELWPQEPPMLVAAFVKLVHLAQWRGTRSALRLAFAGQEDPSR